MKAKEIHRLSDVYFQLAAHSRPALESRKVDTTKLTVNRTKFRKETIDFKNALAAGDFPLHLTNAFVHQSHM